MTSNDSRPGSARPDLSLETLDGQAVCDLARTSNDETVLTAIWTHVATTATASDMRLLYDTPVALAGNRHTPSAVLTEMAHSHNNDPGFHNVDVWHNLAGNPNASGGVLAHLCMNGNERVMEQAALNASCPPTLLERLSHSQSGSVGHAATCNFATPADTIIRPTRDPVSGIADQAVTMLYHHLDVVSGDDTAWDIAAGLLAGWTGTFNDLVAAADGIAALGA
jgi:hypothetical protein